MVTATLLGAFKHKRLRVRVDMSKEKETQDWTGGGGSGSGGGGGGSSPPGSSSVDRVAIRLPPFWGDDPVVWFKQVEAQFDTTGITADYTRYNTVIQQLEHRIAKEVRDIILNPPLTNRYEKLKCELIKRLSVSQNQRIEQLLHHEELGDRKPSQFLRHLRTLAGDQVDDDLLRKLWSGRLPSHVRAILAAQSRLSLDETAELADTVSEVISSKNSQVASLSTAAPSSNLENILLSMEERILARIQDGVRQQIAQLSLNDTSQRGRSTNNGGGRFRNFSRSRSRSRGRYSESQTPGICWYHDSFGNKARKCKAPCKFMSGNQTGSQ